ncbi:uncharacterized protein G2W53_038763 [Senna tora]|uniref:Uncharacterized protein n=1 Tax=Senna tora TaxID=362788 RepID=A0A834W287_9FABA|nr:uncharacterized protein G2W53_038763 [Senna tora]
MAKKIRRDQNEKADQIEDLSCQKK